MIYGDARELAVALQTQFPHSSIKVYRYSESLVLTGFVDRPDHVGPIMRLAEDYAPKVINNINVGGVQQILLKVKVMEISRTKLRRMAHRLGVAWRQRRLLRHRRQRPVESDQQRHRRRSNRRRHCRQGRRVRHRRRQRRVLRLPRRLQENNIAKILAEPNIVAVSGRPAQFNVGGEIPDRRSAEPGHHVASNSSRSARKSTSCRSCWATATSAWKFARGSAKSTTRAASSI